MAKDTSVPFTLTENTLTVNLDTKEGRLAARSLAYALLVTGNKADHDHAQQLFKKVGVHES